MHARLSGTGEDRLPSRAEHRPEGEHGARRPAGGADPRPGGRHVPPVPADRLLPGRVCVRRPLHRQDGVHGVGARGAAGPEAADAAGRPPAGQSDSAAADGGHGRGGGPAPAADGRAARDGVCGGVSDVAVTAGGGVTPSSAG